MMGMKPRRALAILTFVTLDGVMQAPAQPEEDFSGDFKHGGWAFPYWNEVMAEVKKEAMAEPYDLLLGRKTYEIFEPHFSKASDNDDEAALLNNATKYVATNSLKNLEWNNSIPITGDVASGITQLKAEDGPLLQVHGSWQLIQTLLANDLIDEFRLWTFPVVVGSGKRLFGQHPVRHGLTLVKTKATSNGVLMGIYRKHSLRAVLSQPFFLVSHDALDDVGVALSIEQELTDSAIPGSDVGEKLLQAFNAAVGEGGEGGVGPVIDLDHLAIIDIVRIRADDLNQFEAFVDHPGDMVDAEDVGRA